MKRREAAVNEVLSIMRDYQTAFETGTRDDVQRFVHLPVAYITEDSVQLRDRYPFDPEKLRQQSNFDHVDMACDVIHIDETKAHVLITGQRKRADDSLIETVESVYIFQRRDGVWKIAAFSGVRTPAAGS